MLTNYKRLAGIGIFLIFMLGYGLSQRFLWGQDENQPVESLPSKVGVDMQILSFQNKAELQDYMKSICEALGVGCKFCHDITAFEKNVPGLHKGKARMMMRMMKEINSKYFGDEEEKITCFVCHRGREKPIVSKEEYDEVMKQSDKQKDEVF